MSEKERAEIAIKIAKSKFKEFITDIAHIAETFMLNEDFFIKAVLKAIAEVADEILKKEKP